MLKFPLAYKYVMFVMMMAQVNHYAFRLHLQVDLPVREGDFRFVNPDYPYVFNNHQHCGGCFWVGNYSFTFGNESLAMFNVDRRGVRSVGIPLGPRESLISGMERASRMKYIVSTNDIFGVASNCLVALDVDVGALTKNNGYRVDENLLFHSNRGWVPSPLLTVVWKSVDEPDVQKVAEVDVSAVSGELLSVQIGDEVPRKDKPLIKNLSGLLAVSDQDFLNYSSLQRSNLVVNFGGIHYDDSNSFPMDFVTNSSAFRYSVRP